MHASPYCIGLGGSRFFMGAKGNAMVWSLNKDHIKDWGGSNTSYAKAPITYLAYS